MVPPRPNLRPLSSVLPSDHRPELPMSTSVRLLRRTCVFERQDVGIYDRYRSDRAVIAAHRVRDGRKHRHATRLHQGALSLGDVVPASIHPEVDLDECTGSGACVRAGPEKESLATTDGRARLLNPLSCVGPSACMQACPVGAIKLVFGTAARGV